jgi:hypothetical protein
VKEGFWDGLVGGWIALDGTGRLAVIAIVVALLALVSGWVFRRKVDGQTVEEDLKAPVGQGKAGAPALAPPDGVFPGQWFEGLDRPELDDCLAQGGKKAVGAFFEALGGGDRKSPGPDSLSAATGKLADSLKQTLTSPGVFGALAGGAKPSPRELGLMTLHLDWLLPPIRLPSPDVSPGELKPLVVAMMALLGAVAVSSISEMIPGLAPGSAILILSALGAFAGTLLAVFLAQNRRARRWFLARVGGLTILGIIALILKGSLVPSLPSLPRNPILTRIFFCLGALIVLLLVKGRTVYDAKNYEDVVAARVNDYLASQIPLLAVLMFRLKGADIGTAEPESSHKELLGEAAYLVSRLKARPVVAEEPLFNQLVRRFENAGFETGSHGGSPRRLVWDESLADRYETFGLIENGRGVVIEEEPVLKDGKIIRKGQAVPE